MRKPLIAFALIILLIMTQLIATAPLRKSIRVQLNPNYVRAMAAYRRLEPQMARKELRAITAIGILNGARQVEQQMEQHLIDTVKDLLLNTDMSDKDKLVPKIEHIEKQLMRDQRSLEILTSAMDLATEKKDVQEFRNEMQVALQELHSQGAEDIFNEEQVDKETALANRVAVLRQNILKQVESMKNMVDQKIEHTLEYLIEEADENSLLAKVGSKIVRKRDAAHLQEEPAEIRMIKSILTEVVEDDFHNNLVDNGVDHNNPVGNAVEKRRDEFASLEDDLDNFELRDNNVNASRSNGTSLKNGSNSTAAVVVPAKQEEATTETSMEAPENGNGGMQGGGLVGLIAGLSGGEGGSDVGALIGALTGLVSTLFGPGGLDIEALISTATSLISGLLSGNKNFDTVLGQYVGTALDGVSGGGGAINNGQFLGNFLGTVVASLSADPEEDDAPLQPFVFVQNLVSSFMEAKNRKGSGEASEERKGEPHKGGTPAATGGSDSSGFIKHIASHLVSTALGFILNASVGASGGASHASTGLFHSSSSSHSKPAPAGIKSW